MPNKYKRRPGSRLYVDYSAEVIEECLNNVKSKQMTQRQAARHYGIPRSTIKNKLKGKHSNKPGHPTVFSEEEENAFVAHTTALSEYGFPITSFDLTFIIKDYLAAQGRTVPQFKNNVPGVEWTRSFLNRHKELSRRLANNIKRARAQISEEIITEFIGNLTLELQDVPPENIFNYDETNLTDDPGKKRVICRRGSKYPENVINSTKVSYSVMFCGSASGEVIPPYVVYKADHLWSTWTENGPPGARYNRTKSGWFDSVTFEDWFINHFLPILKKKEGKKVIIGDNLSSHINPKVLQECEKNNISFLCLPANATHILQPLDVAYFRPLKVKWRQTLLKWKTSPEGRRLATTPKDQFPALLKETLESLTGTPENIKAGFKKTGIMPINQDEPLSRLPKQDRIVNLELIGDSFMNKLEETRKDSPTAKAPQKKKLTVAAGRSICAADLAEAGTSGVVQPLPKKSATGASTSGVKQHLARKIDAQASTSTSGKSLAKKRTKPLKTMNKKKAKRGRPRKVRLDDSATTSCSSHMSEVSSTHDLPDDVLSDDMLDFEGPLEDLPDDFEMLPSPGSIENIENGQETKPLKNQLEEKLNDQEMLLSKPQVEENTSDQVKDHVSPIILVVDPNDEVDKDQSAVDLTAEDPEDDVPLAMITKPKKPKASMREALAVDDHVLFTWEAKVYPGKVISLSEEGVLVGAMKKGVKFWRWPVIKDEQLYRWEDIIKKINPPKFLKKNCFVVPELDQ